MAEITSQKPGINAWSPEFIESLYESWKQDASSVDSQWQFFFQGFDLGASHRAAVPSPDTTGKVVADPDYVAKSGRVNSLVFHYRDVGHLAAKLDPLGRERPWPETLQLEAFDLTEADLDTPFQTSIAGFESPAKLRDIIANLRAIYCNHLGAEYTHIQNSAERRWLRKRLERTDMCPYLRNEEKRGVLRKLHQAEMFESFLHTRYKGEKRFSLEGSETLIPMLWRALESAGEFGVEEVVLGMAHRGRLNVLANIINKAYDEIFAEFEGNYENLGDGGGDVKYHKGYSTNFLTTSGRLLNITLAANPSHLEAVDPVVEGRCRAKQRLRGDAARTMVMPILIHGDAAFAGQGVVAETLQMVTLPGYTTGGTIHFIINNQIGFTTDPMEARSSVYCTDVAKMVQAPIFHVNGDDPELCANITKLAIEYRQTFHKDVVIDMWCYRKHGHNEGDEPAYTQPRMYDLIRTKEQISSIFARQLEREGVISAEDTLQMKKDLEEVLEMAQVHGRENKVRKNKRPFSAKWEGMENRYTFEPVDTTFSETALREIASRVAELPPHFNCHPKLLKQLLARRDSVLNRVPMDWGTVETLTYGSLLWEGTPIRVSGQDSQRGTFTHRHAVLVDTTTEENYTPLNFIKDGQARFCIYDSPLAEASVVGFEYGYSLGDPQMLIIWEAQFGDFANGAQVIVDQFIASAEKKWDRFSGLVFFLPHGYEGQGPEHSSARLERFLQLCADDNIQVANLTTPAQLFHILRRQMKRKFRKPLIIMSPKSLLRHPKAVSTVDELTGGSFEEILDDPEMSDRSAVRRVLLMSGKVYYDLLPRRTEVGRDDTAFIRLEQIYPLHAKKLKDVLARYPNAREFHWVQEEPKNMGPWTHISDSLMENVGLKVEYIGRPAASTPAVGSKKAHDQELRELLEWALPAQQAKVAKVQSVG